MENEVPSSFLPLKIEMDFLEPSPGEVLQDNLLNLFCKTRTNYSNLVPKIFRVMEAFRKGGPDNCPVPVFHHFSTLLQEKTILSLDTKEADGESMGFLALCTERKAVRSGGGGKYYFLSSSGRLVGCSKSDLHSRKKEPRSSPVLLKNLVFLFLHQEMDVFKIDPRARSSNPQRLLDFYESLQAVGKEQSIRRLLKVWSMEVVCEESKGFPYCSVLWIKDMDIQSSLAKWRGSTSCQHRFQFLPPSPDHQLSFPAFSGRIAADPFPSNYTPFKSFSLGPPLPSDLHSPLGAPLDALELFRNYQVASEFLTDADMHRWCSTIVHSLSPKTVLAAASVLESILRIQIVMSQNDNSEADPELTRQLLFGFASKAQKPELVSVLRVLLACLLREQQQPEATFATDIPEYLFSVQ
eukprot:GHVP01065836.1.p2 GENE.GHVP01065836.1~~GHVP01065836.1.p2  ORF type:complete len:410 (-),score=79.26 GHVP01065836.1:1681-2910(-)